MHKIVMILSLMALAGCKPPAPPLAKGFYYDPTTSVCGRFVQYSIWTNSVVLELKGGGELFLDSGRVKNLRPCSEEEKNGR